MFPLHSNIENNIYPLYVLEDRWKPDGSIIESNWDYKEGYVDLTIDDWGVHNVLRIPFYAVAGSLDYPGVTVRVDQPFLLIHERQTGINGTELGRRESGTAGQVQSPEDADADVSQQHKIAGERIMKKVEGMLLPG